MTRKLQHPRSVIKYLSIINQVDNELIWQGSHSYGSYFLEYSLMAEFNLLQKQKLPGIYCIPSAKSPLVWFGVLFIRQGPYQEGVFR